MDESSRNHTWFQSHFAPLLRCFGLLPAKPPQRSTGPIPKPEPRSTGPIIKPLELPSGTIPSAVPPKSPPPGGSGQHY